MQRSFGLIQTARRIHRDAVLSQVSSVRPQSVQCSVVSSVTHSPGDGSQLAVRHVAFELTFVAGLDHCIVLSLTLRSCHE